MKIEIQKIFISEGHDFKGRHGMERLRHGVSELESIECVAGKGIVGDRFFEYKDDFKGQITFFERAVADQVFREAGAEDSDLSRFRRNVIVDGVDLNELVGKRFTLGDVVFIGVEECAPCYWMDQAIGEGAESILKGRGGLRCRIEKSGTLSLDDCELQIID